MYRQTVEDHVVELRLLQEALETATGLHAIGAVSAVDMAKMLLLCEGPPEHGQASPFKSSSLGGGESQGR